MSNNTFYLEIVTPDRQFYSGKAESLVIPAIDGMHGVLAGHEPMITAIIPGGMKFQADGVWKNVAVGEGFVDIKPDYVIMLVDTAELPEEIDINRAKAAKERAEERLRQRKSNHEHTHSEAALSRALARLKVSSEHFNKFNI